MAWSPDGKTLASGSTDKTVRLWDATTGQSLRTLSGNLLAVLSVAWSPDGKTLASVGADKTVRLWDAATGQSLHILSSHTDAVTVLMHSWWNIGNEPGRSAPSSRTLPLLVHYYPVTSVAWSPDGKTLASASNDQTVQLWDVSVLP